MNAHANVPAMLPSLPEIVAEFDEKWARIPELIKEYEAFHNRLDVETTVRGTYVGRVYSYHPGLYTNTLQSNLLKSAWKHIYNGLNIKEIASAKDRKRFEMALEDPPEFTIDNIRATFGEFVRDPRFHILKGLAECFVDLDQSFKSHSKIKIGVQGLPKRIINNVVGDFGIQGYGANQLRDVLNAIRVFQGREHIDYSTYDRWLNVSRGKMPAWNDKVCYSRGNIVVRDDEIYICTSPTKAGDWLDEDWALYEDPEPNLTLKVFQNGNGHLHFGAEMLRKVNLALAEFYGDILPDVEPDKSEMKRRQSTEVSKDLQYYPTPRAVINEILRGQDFQDGQKVLEPSCGDGRILDALADLAERRESGRAGVSLKMPGVETHSGRVEEARQKGHTVMNANFLQTIPKAEFDYVIMNPPFYGTHWKKHLEHALKFLKPKEEGSWRRGVLICILPATAFYDGHLGEMGLVRKDAHLNDRGWRDSGWKDLPVASFAESGTNVPTGYLVTTGGRYDG